MSESPLRTPLSHVDAAWLRMDSPVNPMVITVALVFEGHIPFGRIERVISERLLPHARFREHVVDPALPLSAPYWQVCEGFQLGNHLHHLRVPAPADRASFAALVSDLMSTRLDPSQPLWQAYVVDDALSGTALVARLHHCIGDGVSLVRLLLSLCDGLAHPAPAQVGLKRAAQSHDPLELSKRALSQATTLGRLLLLPSDTPTPLKGKLGIQKVCAWSEAFDLEPVRVRAHELTATINDVLCAAVTGALRSYLERRDCMRSGLQIRSMVPVFFRDDDPGALGNHFGLVFLDLPVGEADPIRRVRAIKHSMDTIKGADDATVAFGVLDAIGTASADLEHIALDVFTRKATLLTTNVPGPAETILLDGAPVRDLLVWAPVSGYIGLGVSLVSYAGKVRLGVNADRGLVESPQEIVEAFELELRALLALPARAER